MNEPDDAPAPKPSISLLLSDVDGTLVTDDKRLTPATIEAVRRLGERGILFSITSARPPRGLQHIIDALHITTPIAGFNSGMIVDASQQVLRQQPLDAAFTRRVIGMFEARNIDIWLFSGNDWLIKNPAGVYVALEEMTIGYGPIVVASFEPAFGTATKIMGVSDDFPMLAQCEAEMRGLIGAQASVALSQKYYLDITHAAANKGSAVLALADLTGIPTSRIATIGDMSNDVAMFEKSGFSIAMGNATDAVKAKATATTDTNENDGFAKAVERYLL
jgi:Cof subfamily protein (haloacid dehalogenase superfamily)